MLRKPLVADSNKIQPYQVLGERITIIADHGQTGSYEVYLHDAPKDAGPPPHTHPWDEAFYVIEGEVDFECGGEKSKVGPGGFVHVPSGTLHTFRYASPTAKVLGFTSAGGAAAMFADIDRTSNDGPADMDKIVSVLAAHKVKVAM